MKIAVITSSDRAYHNIYSDQSGPAIQELLKQHNPSWEIEYRVLPDDFDLLCAAFHDASSCDWIITTGGTGISPRDCTADAARQFCTHEIPGIGEYLRQESRKETLFAVFSRGFAGYRGKCILVNLPGSLAAATYCTKLLLPLLEHGSKMIHGGDH